MASSDFLFGVAVLLILIIFTVNFITADFAEIFGEDEVQPTNTTVPRTETAPAEHVTPPPPSTITYYIIREQTTLKPRQGPSFKKLAQLYTALEGRMEAAQHLKNTKAPKPSKATSRQTNQHAGLEIAECAQSLATKLAKLEKKLKQHDAGVKALKEAHEKLEEKNCELNEENGALQARLDATIRALKDIEAAELSKASSQQTNQDAGLEMAASSQSLATRNAELEEQLEQREAGYENLKEEDKGMANGIVERDEKITALEEEVEEAKGNSSKSTDLQAKITELEAELEKAKGDSSKATDLQAKVDEHADTISTQKTEIIRLEAELEKVNSDSSKNTDLQAKIDEQTDTIRAQTKQIDEHKTELSRKLTKKDEDHAKTLEQKTNAWSQERKNAQIKHDQIISDMQDKFDNSDRALKQQHSEALRKQDDAYIKNLEMAKKEVEGVRQEHHTNIAKLNWIHEQLTVEGDKKDWKIQYQAEELKKCKEDAHEEFKKWQEELKKCREGAHKEKEELEDRIKYFARELKKLSDRFKNMQAQQKATPPQEDQMDTREASGTSSSTTTVATNQGSGVQSSTSTTTADTEMQEAGDADTINIHSSKPQAPATRPTQPFNLAEAVAGRTDLPRLPKDIDPSARITMGPLPFRALLTDEQREENADWAMVRKGKQESWDAIRDFDLAETEELKMKGRRKAFYAEILFRVRLMKAPEGWSVETARVPL
jgi:chromosome segregation ATPase